MPECVNCGGPITVEDLSQFISENPSYCYAQCAQCDNVMIAKVEDGEIVELRPTPEDDSPETIAMIRQAQQLFRGTKVEALHNLRLYEGSEIIDDEVGCPEYGDYCHGCEHLKECYPENVEENEEECVFDPDSKQCRDCPMYILCLPFDPNAKPKSVWPEYVIIAILVTAVIYGMSRMFI